MGDFRITEIARYLSCSLSSRGIVNLHLLFHLIMTIPQVCQGLNVFFFFHRRLLWPVYLAFPFLRPDGSLVLF